MDLNRIRNFFSKERLYKFNPDADMTPTEKDKFGEWQTTWGVTNPEETLEKTSKKSGKTVKGFLNISTGASFEKPDPLYDQPRAFAIYKGVYEDDEPFLYFMGEVSNCVWATGLLTKPSKIALELIENKK